jgi:glycosyltransferase involved in cell wall biosynthesis
MVYLNEIGIPQRIHLMRGIKDEELCRLYQRAAAFVFPSLYEGLGLPVLEAMACGCPVVASRIPTTEFTAGDVPFYFDPGDPGTLITALDSALAHGKEPGRVQQGIRRATRFTWDRTAQATLGVYRSLHRVGTNKRLRVDEHTVA